MIRIPSILRAVTVFALIALPLSAPGFAADAGSAGPGAGFLSGPAAGDALDIALAYIQEHRQELGLTEADLSDWVLKNRYVTRHNGVTHIYLRQRLNGVEVYNGDLAVNVAADGSIVSLHNGFVADLAGKAAARSPELSPEAAVQHAARQLDLELSEPLVQIDNLGGPANEIVFSGGGISQQDIPVHLLYQPLEDGGVRLTWDVNIYPHGGAHWWSARVDAASGEMLSLADWVAYDSYNVYALPKESPNDGPRTVETDPAEATASPFGWHDTNGAAGAEFTDTRGNNVDAQTDLDANNVFSAGDVRASGGAGLDFDDPIDLGMDPSTYREAVVANLFYWNNIVHDVLYQYGFDEASGNFQANNYGRGGLGNDQVQADAQDGSGTNNANFSTPIDGSSGRMQMFIWTPPTPNILRVNSPPVIAGDYPASSANFGPPVDTTGITGDMVLVTDGVGATNDGCETLTNPGAVNGKIALADRGNCNFTVKVANAQAAGAVATIIANDRAGNPITLGGTDGTITIPSGMISQTDGNTIKSELGGGVNATFRNAGAAAPPNRDSDLDNGVIAHEYGHGVSNRLTGGAGNAGCLQGNQSRGMGEGWSDFWALAFSTLDSDQPTDGHGIATYVSFEGAGGLGIRPAPYSTDMVLNPRTYSELVNAGQSGGLSIPHGVGTVWASMLWEMYWNLVADYGFDSDIYFGTGGNNLAMRLVIDGMKLQPCSPRFIDARDGILMADQVNNGGANQCRIWEAFAKRGLGFGATGGVNHNDLNVTESFVNPLGPCPIFADGFESGDTASWSATVVP